MEKIIYLDNAATSYPKPNCVTKDLPFCLKKYSGNPSRSSHRLSIKTSEAVYEVREKISDFFCAGGAEHVVFTYNATYALNLAIKSFVREKCHILTSDFEHNSVIRPLEALKLTHKIEYTAVNTDDLINNLSKAKRSDTRGIVISLSSNVTGDRLSLDDLSKFAENNSLFLIVDASQAAGHFKIDLSKTPCDVLCAPGHKALFGIMGSAVAIFKSNKRLESFIEGGSGSESLNIAMPSLLPEGYEAGTLGVPAIITLGRGIDFINSVGIESIETRLNYLTDNLEKKLIELKKIKLYKKGCGILSFNLGDLPSSFVASELDKYGICVRGGLHCAPSVHKKIGTLNQGAVRVSFSFLNKNSDSDKLYSALKAIIKNEK